MENTKKNELAALLMQTGQGHHKAFIKTDGADLEWPLWYSEYLKEALPALLGTRLTRSQIIYELIKLDETTDTSNQRWTLVYTEELLKKYR